MTRSCIATRGVAITACSPKLTLFPLPKESVVVTADGGAFTFDAGVLLVQQMDQHLGLSAAPAQSLPGTRDPAKVQHSLLALLRQAFPWCQMELRVDSAGAAGRGPGRTLRGYR